MKAIDGWAEMRRTELAKSRKVFEAREDYHELLDAAAQRGLRRVTLAEQVEGDVSHILWRGGVWVAMTYNADFSRGAAAPSAGNEG